MMMVWFDERRVHGQSAEAGVAELERSSEYLAGWCDQARHFTTNFRAGPDPDA